MNKYAFPFLMMAFGMNLAHAGTVQLTVTDKDGQPAADVVVLLQQAVKTVPRPAAAPVVITQENSHFEPFLTIVPVGSTVRFSNKDGYDHHVRSTPSGPLGSIPAAKNFELRLDALPAATSSSNSYDAPQVSRKGSGVSSGEVKMDQPGAIGLGCHIHGSMRGQLYVSDTPWFAKTNAKGLAVIQNVPDGASQITLWHPDQLQEQTPVAVQVSATPLQTVAQLNFTPRRRR